MFLTVTHRAMYPSLHSPTGGQTLAGRDTADMLPTIPMWLTLNACMCIDIYMHVYFIIIRDILALTLTASHIGKECWYLYIFRFGPLDKVVFIY